MSRGVKDILSPENYNAVLDNARNAEGQLCCDHCSTAITDEQTISIHHIVPRRIISPERFDGSCADLGISQQDRARWADAPLQEKKIFLNRHLNSPDNLRPMHVACHAKVDFGRSYPETVAAELNRKPEYRTINSATKKTAEALMEMLIADPESEALDDVLEATPLTTLRLCDNMLMGRMLSTELSKQVNNTSLTAQLQKLLPDHKATLRQELKGIRQAQQRLTNHVDSRNAATQPPESPQR